MMNISAPVPIPPQNPLNPFPAWRLPNGIINASETELEKSIESCERWEWFGGGLVVVGVIAEVAIAVIHPPYDSFLEQWGSSLANSLVAIGVALEIKFGQMAGLRQNELKRRSDEQVAIANARAEEANQRAQEAALELARLNKKIAPRVITDEQEEVIIAKIKSFAETPFGIAADPAAEYRFINRLIMVLQRAGWKWMQYSVAPSTLPLGAVLGFDIPESKVSGVQLRINRSKLDDFMKPAQELASALTQALQAGVSIAADPSESALACPPDMIHIEIYRKL